jgi:hypothetical protein
MLRLRQRWDRNPQWIILMILRVNGSEDFGRLERVHSQARRRMALKGVFQKRCTSTRIATPAPESNKYGNQLREPTLYGKH